MFQCFATRNIWPGIFTFSLTLFQFVVKRFETFQSSDLVIFWVCFNLFQLIYYIIYMFHVSQQEIYGLEFSPFL